MKAVVKAVPKALVKRGRPPKALEVTGIKSLPDRVKAIDQYHRAAQTCAAQAVIYGVLCGMELIAARKEVPDGEWVDWLKGNVPFAQGTAYKYEEAARRKTPEIEKLMKVMGFSAGVAPHLLTEPGTISPFASSGVGIEANFTHEIG